MHVTGTHFNYYHICHRKLWLFSNGVKMEHTSDTVYDGKLIHENSYPQRSAKYEEMEIDGCKIDFYDSRNKVIHEIKKSNKIESAHEWQVRYYIHILEKNGIKGVTGILEYPTLRRTQEVSLSEDDKLKIFEYEKEIISITENDICPPVICSKKCTQCSYYDFCYVEEIE
ncbi:MAG: CRISPR-associated protein Cas4 [Bacteroidetes bacterium HGW-Bacteroidetes-8]|nr:MAG: CRISPR-associated protein Cas4 [Bacteroidetes bacterium HGW-Bacteroidetes-8]